MQHDGILCNECPAFRITTETSINVTKKTKEVTTKSLHLWWQEIVRPLWRGTQWTLVPAASYECTDWRCITRPTDATVCAQPLIRWLSPKLNLPILIWSRVHLAVACVPQQNTKFSSSYDLSFKSLWLDRPMNDFLVWPGVPRRGNGTSISP